MATLDDLAERIERLVLRYEESLRTSTLLQQQLDAVTGERDSLRARLAAARTRIDTLLERLPAAEARKDASLDTLKGEATAVNSAPTQGLV
jgi:cell division protein ZapB